MPDASCPPPLHWHPASGTSGPEAIRARENAAAYARRCRSLPPVTGGEVERLVAVFLAGKGQVKQCPPAYGAPVR